MSADPPPFGADNLRISPSGPFVPGGGSGIIQMGFDQVLEKIELPATLFDVVPRVAAPGTDPLRVILPGVTPGNYLRIQQTRTADYNAQEAEDGFLVTVPVVSFDGSTVFPGTFSFIANAYAGTQAILGQTMSAAAHTFVQIPDGATDAVIELGFSALGVGIWDISGTDPDSLLFAPYGCRLEAWEVSSSVIAAPAYPLAPGFGVLVPIAAPP